VLAAVVVGIGSHSQAQAQESGEKSRSFQAAILFGRASDSRSESLESAMKAAGFADPSYSLFGSSAMPHSSKGSPLTFTAQYRLRSAFSAGIVIATTGEGETTGLHGFAQFLKVEHAARTVAVTASARFKVLRLEFGPSWNQTRVRELGTVALASIPSPWKKDDKLGFVAGASLSVPVWSVIYVDAGLQYRHIGSSVSGPFTPASFFDTPMTFPATKINFSHWFFGIGPGIRF
jgi:hypothetical protein